MSDLISWNDLWPNSKKNLKDDDDIITVSVEDNFDSFVTIQLELAQNLTWWKAIALLDANNTVIGREITVQDNNKVDSVAYTQAQIAAAVKLEFRKAKVLGVHTGVYYLDMSTIQAHLQTGKLITFNWYQDSHQRHIANLVFFQFPDVQSMNADGSGFTVVADANFTAKARVSNDTSSSAIIDPGMGFVLASQEPENNLTWGSNRWSLGNIIGVGDGLDITQTFKAPSVPGVYPFAWRVIQEDVEAVSDINSLTATVVDSTLTRAAQFVSQSVPASIEFGSTAQAVVTLLNTGTAPWKSANQYRLGSQDPQDNLNWGRNRFELTGDVLPGQQVSFHLDLTPKSVGVFGFQWQMVQELVTWFGDVSPAVNISVTASGNTQICADIAAKITDAQQQIQLLQDQLGTNTHTDAAIQAKINKLESEIKQLEQQAKNNGCS